MVMKRKFVHGATKWLKSQWLSPPIIYFLLSPLGTDGGGSKNTQVIFHIRGDFPKEGWSFLIKRRVKNHGKIEQGKTG